jgi:hypothetical protein
MDTGTSSAADASVFSISTSNIVTVFTTDSNKVGTYNLRVVGKVGVFTIAS